MSHDASAITPSISVSNRSNFAPEKTDPVPERVVEAE
jgi:hypothetical protein